MTGGGPSRPGQDPRRVARLFTRWREHGDHAARAQLVEAFMPLALSLVRRYQRSSEPTEDLVQVASLGLVKAVDGFELRAGNSFAAYAIPTILGELRRYFRDSGWALHVPRRDKELAQTVADARRQLMSSGGHAPTAQQVAELTELDLEDVLTGLAASGAYATLPFETRAPDGEHTVNLIETIGGIDPAFRRVERRATVAAALRTLPERELELLRLRFGEELSQAAIGARFGVSQMQVSRLLERCFARLRAAIEEGSEDQPAPVEADGLVGGGEQVMAALGA